MGLGDVTLMAFVGAALGPTRALITVFLGATLGAVAFGVRGHSGRAAPPRPTARADGARARKRAVRDAARPVRRFPCACRVAHVVLGRCTARLVGPLGRAFAALRPTTGPFPRLAFANDWRIPTQRSCRRCAGALHTRSDGRRRAPGDSSPCAAATTKSRASSTSCCATARTIRRSSDRLASARRRSPKGSRSASPPSGCPSSCVNVRLLSLDHVGLLAGTTYRGQYEERIRALVAETTAAADVILFIDELHNLIGQGTAIGAAMDAANMLKPALVRGDFRVIGATTSDEYETVDRRRSGARAAFSEGGRTRARRSGDAGDSAGAQGAPRASSQCAHLRRSVARRRDAHRPIRHRPHAPRQGDRRPRRGVRALAGRGEVLASYRAIDRAAHRGAQGHGAHRPRTRRRASRRPRQPEPDQPANAFERFGAELEALFVGAPVGDADRRPDARRTAPAVQSVRPRRWHRSRRSWRVT